MPIRKEYTIETESVNAPGTWEKTKVSVYRHSADGTKTKVGEYGRNYSMLRTFEPFRQYKNGIWKNYALISTSYTRLSVMDLSTGEIIAVEEYPKITQERYDSYYKKYQPDAKVGDPMPGAGFCPADFYVPDFYDDEEDNPDAVQKEKKSVDDLIASMENFSPENRKDVWGKEYLEELAWQYSGNWGVYSGCVWGDDSSWKLRYVDLSRIDEGIVITDERFGYVELPSGKLRDLVEIEAEAKRVKIAVPLYFDMESGKAQYQKYFNDNLNWA